MRLTIHTHIGIICLLLCFCLEGQAQQLCIYSHKGRLLKRYTQGSEIQLNYAPVNRKWSFMSGTFNVSSINTTALLNTVADKSIVCTYSEYGATEAYYNEADLVATLNLPYETLAVPDLEIPLTAINAIYRDRKGNDIGGALMALGTFAYLASPLFATHYDKRTIDPQRFFKYAGISVGVIVGGFITAKLFPDKVYRINTDAADTFGLRYKDATLKIEADPDAETADDDY